MELSDPDTLQKKPKVEDLVFGKFFTDHMLRIPWNKSQGWGKPTISKLQNMEMHPGAKVCDNKLIDMNDYPI